MEAFSGPGAVSLECIIGRSSPGGGSTSGPEVSRPFGVGVDCHYRCLACTGWRMALSNNVDVPYIF